MDRLQLARELLSQPGARIRRSPSGEDWVDHHCLFHDDRHRSASCQPDSGVYYCHACARVYSLVEVQKRLGLSVGGQGFHEPSPPPRPGHQAQPVLLSTTDYPYADPSGRLTAIHRRLDYQDGSKEMPWFHPNGLTPGRPANTWFCYDERLLASSQILFCVEGEKCVDAVNTLNQNLVDHPIRALTPGGVAQFHSPDLLVQRLQQLQPEALLLWPDHDPPGQEAMHLLHLALNRARLPHVLVEPERYNLGPSQDVADFIRQGGSLAQVLTDYWPSLSVQQNGSGLVSRRLGALLAETVMFGPDRFIFPGTQNATQLDLATLESLWYNAYGTLPPAQAGKQLRAALQVKGQTRPARVVWRHHPTQDCFWWRSSREEAPYLVSAQAISRSEPEGLFLLAPPASRYPPGVEPDGSEADWRSFCDLFVLAPMPRLLCLAWLCSGLLGSSTAILLLKGDAATGKTTLATHLGALLDPDLPTISAGRADRDPREFIRTAQTHPALLLDNASTVSAEFEDTLSKLVTGDTASLRVLYKDVVESVHLQRPVAVTTTTWDIAKGDLASRMWPIQPQIPAGYRDEDDLARQLQPLLPRLRGYLFKQCQAIYGRPLTTSSSQLRLGSRVLSALGADLAEVHAYLQLARSELIAQGEPWLDALVECWEAVRETGPHRWEPTQLCAYLYDRCREQVSTKALAGFIRPRQALFPSYGFRLSWGKGTRGQRYYLFEPAE